MDTILSFIDTLGPESIIRYGGITLLMVIVFAETGILFCCFLPGDSLLFTAGLLSGSEYLPAPIGWLIVALIVAAFVGTIFGYYFGRWAGHKLKDRKDNFFYRKKYMEATSDFYRKHGFMAFVFGRFLPIIRTFIPVMAGVVNIDFKRFMIYNFAGAVCWVTSVILAGRWLGNQFPALIDSVELIVLVMAVVSAIPMMIALLRKKEQVK